MRFLSLSARLPATLAALTLSAGAARAEFLVHPLFTDHGVLQQEMPVPVWGWADPGTSVTVEFAGQKKEATADDGGVWMAILDPLKASAEPATLTISGGEAKVTVSDLLVGEVWVCSGQSNMAFATGGSTDADAMSAEAAEGKFAQIRLFKVPVDGKDERQTTVNAAWQTCAPETVARFTAAGFYFGRALNEARKVPVGLIQSANGGTNANSWINRDTLDNDPAAAVTREAWKQTVAAHPQAMERHQKALEAWKAEVKAAKAEGREVKGRAPREPLGPDHVKRPAGHYNAMIAPLQPCAIRGALWYQGEANSRPPYAPQYKDLMFALVEDWRADWTGGVPGIERRDFPFYLVQLPNFAGGDPRGWPVIREQMLKFWQEGRNTGMVTTIDVGDPGDIHPRNKKPVGERLARFARAATYGEDIVYSGPIYDSVSIEGGKAVLKFKHAGGGLKSRDGQPLRHFQVAGADGRFVEAEAAISGDGIVVSSPDVPEPRAVRYAWSNNPENPNFVNAEDLLASPFRTDSWEIDWNAPAP
ncbi:MAG: sialate O-acetylesterase [Akkermansiaceae bacterium]|nr:sialate O-acetylesterase [Akkermansiaceae bacterium]